MDGIRPFARTTAAGCRPLVALLIATGFCRSGFCICLTRLFLACTGLASSGLLFQLSLGLADPLQPAGTPLQFLRQLIISPAFAELPVFLIVDDLGLAQQSPHLSLQLPLTLQPPS